jgi:membrane protease YdiL (CAAX protease family)
MLRPIRNWWWLAPVWIIGANGLIDFLGFVNEWLITPGGALDQMFRAQEENAERLTELILSGTTVSAIITTIITVAIVPAVAEELVFRGVLQPLLARASRSIHVAIWLSAFLFSFIHFQFFGFLPRLVMGAMLGYLVIWSGSLYTAIIAHCLNNLVAVFLFKADGMTASIESQALVAAGLSFLLTAAGAFWMMRKSQWPWNSFAYMGITSPSAKPPQDANPQES